MLDFLSTTTAAASSSIQRIESSYHGVGATNCTEGLPLPRAALRAARASSFLTEFEFSAPRVEEPLENYRLMKPGED
eukprot:5080410-Amphidinium_carterae.1